MSSDAYPTVIDLFSGAGGLSAGLETAGWQTVAAVDSDLDAIATLRLTRLAGIRISGSRRTYLEKANLLHTDVANLSASELRPLGATRSWRPDLLAGGPPCQPFSSAGRMRSLEDPRGRLFLHFVRIAKALRPRFVLFENVPGLVTAKSLDGKPGGVLKFVQEAFEEIGYTCRFALLNAADYGAYQRRVRLYMIGALSERLPEFPLPTHGRKGSRPVDDREEWRSLGSLLARMPDPDVSEIVRPSRTRAKEMAALMPGTGLRTRGIVEANRPGGHWGYRQDCFIADLSLPSRTIRAATTPDWIRLPDGSLRRLTWKECAALQGFHPQWKFHGGSAARFRQIGNAVQGDVAFAIGVVLRDAAARRDAPHSLNSPCWPASFHKRVRYTAMEHATNAAARAEAARVLTTR